MWWTAGKLDIVERLAGFAEARGHTLLELALSWLAARPRIASVIAGATSPEQVRANAVAVEAWRLTEAGLEEVDRLLRDRLATGLTLLDGAPSVAGDRSAMLDGVGKRPTHEQTTERLRRLFTGGGHEQVVAVAHEAARAARLAPLPGGLHPAVAAALAAAGIDELSSHQRRHVRPARATVTTSSLPPVRRAASRSPSSCRRSTPPPATRRRAPCTSTPRRRSPRTRRAS